MLRIWIRQNLFWNNIHFMFLMCQTRCWFCCCFSCSQGVFCELIIAWLGRSISMKYIWSGVTWSVAPFSVYFTVFTSWSTMIYFTDYLKSSIRSLIVVVKSVCFTYDKFEVPVASVVVSVEVVGAEHVFVEGYTTRNKYWFGLVN